MNADYQSESLSPDEWKEIALLLVEPDPAVRRPLLTALGQLCLGGIDNVADHDEALTELKSKSYSHLIFSTTATSLNAVEFLAAVMNVSSDIVALPCSADPDVDQVFDLLMLGARAYLVVPVSVESLSHVVSVATKTEAIPDAMIEGNDKHRSISNMLVNCLDDIAAVMRRAKDSGEEPTALPDLMSKFRDAAEVARVFSSGSELDLIESLQEVCIEKAKVDTSTRLGKVRKRLAAIRKV